MKNPWVSDWLSAANALTGAARGRGYAEARRAQAAWLAETNRRMMSLWFPGVAQLKPKPVRVKRSRKPR